MKVALAHDDFVQFGGAERLVYGMRTIWPDACIYTSIAWKKENDPLFRTSWMQRLPLKQLLHRFYFPLYPLAFEGISIPSYDCLISSSSRFAHGIITKPQSTHIWYCHTPPRVGWDTKRYLSKKVRAILAPWIAYYRVWDQVAAARVDGIIANSQYTRRRVQAVYRRDATVVYPFVDTDYFTPGSQGTSEFWLVVSRLLRHKRIDVAIGACNRLKKRLIIVGDGPEKSRLVKLAGPTITIQSGLTDSELLEYYRGCLGLIVPGEEDFGMVALEALACGKPVVACNRGGVTEIVNDGATGTFYNFPDIDSLATRLAACKPHTFHPNSCRLRSKEFSLDRFAKKLEAVVSEIVQKKHG